MLVTTSPGLIALPLGMFSQAGIRPTRLIFGFSCATARKVPSTLAAPPMSNFISSISAAGLIEMPPVSKVMPLPTSTSGAADLAAPWYCSTMNFSGCMRTLRHRQEAAHAELFDVLAVQHLDLQVVRLGQAFRLVGQVGGRAMVARPVGAFARQRHAGGDGIAALQALAHSRGLGHTAGQRDALQLRRRAAPTAWCGGTRRAHRRRPRSGPGPAPRRAAAAAPMPPTDGAHRHPSAAPGRPSRRP